MASPLDPVVANGQITFPAGYPVRFIGPYLNQYNQQQAYNAKAPQQDFWGNFLQGGMGAANQYLGALINQGFENDKLNLTSQLAQQAHAANAGVDFNYRQQEEEAKLARENQQRQLYGGALGQFSDLLNTGVPSGGQSGIITPPEALDQGTAQPLPPTAVNPYDVASSQYINTPGEPGGGFQAPPETPEMTSDPRFTGGATASPVTPTQPMDPLEAITRMGQSNAVGMGILGEKLPSFFTNNLDPLARALREANIEKATTQAGVNQSRINESPSRIGLNEARRDILENRIPEIVAKVQDAQYRAQIQQELMSGNVDPQSDRGRFLMTLMRVNPNNMLTPEERAYQMWAGQLQAWEDYGKNVNPVPRQPAAKSNDFPPLNGFVAPAKSESERKIYYLLQGWLQQHPEADYTDTRNAWNQFKAWDDAMRMSLNSRAVGPMGLNPPLPNPGTGGQASTPQTSAPTTGGATDASRYNKYLKDANKKKQPGD